MRTFGSFRDPALVLLAFCFVSLPGLDSAAQGGPGTSATPAADPVVREIEAVDPALWRLIETTPAVDNHAHPLLSPPAMATDRGFDALPVDDMAPETDPLAWRPDFAPMAAARAALFGVAAESPLTPADQVQLDAARERVRKREGSHYSDWVLDQAGIGTMLANRVTMGTGVAPPRFLWVPYDDTLLFPLSNVGLMAGSPDRKQFFQLEGKLQARYLADLHMARLPPTLDGYLRQVVTPTLQAQKAGGAVAIKFEVAYLRSLDFSDVPEAEADAVYRQFIQTATASAPGLVPDPAGYKRLQDFLFRYLALEAGRLGMVVHLHGMAGGGRYFSIAGVNPLLLEPLLNDPRFGHTQFVLLHGGWPYVREAGAMLQKPNFYLDMSQQAILFPARTLSGWLREWLETYPEKVLFGTDAYPYSPAMGWEESAWYAAHNEREALGLALTGMERDGEITPARAAALARMVLRGNAEGLYGLAK